MNKDFLLISFQHTNFSLSVIVMIIFSFHEEKCIRNCRNKTIPQTVAERIPFFSYLFLYLNKIFKKIENSHI